MDISSQLVSYVESLQDKADRSFELYPQYQCVLPNDAIYLARLTNLRAVCDLIETGCNQYNKSVEEVIRLSIIPNLDAINKHYPYISEALNAIVEKYGPQLAERA